MVAIIVLLLAFSVVSATEYYCDSDRFPLVTDLAPDDCNNAKYYYYKENAVNGCFPGCVLTSTRPTVLACSDTSLCPAGYYCAYDNKPCNLNETSCYKYYVLRADYYVAKWKPTCQPDESWAPKQCKGETANGRCFCFDGVGNRIFGEEFSYQAEDMTCACSRRRAELEANGDSVFVSLHCDSMGNYESLQCDIDSEQCWCVEPKTGEETAPVVPMSLMSVLPCYNATAVGSQYLRQCESQLYAQQKITDEFLVHGTLKINYLTLVCQYDGSYGPYTIASGIAYCVWKDGTTLGSYQTSTASTALSTINCRCALDAQIYADAGKSHSLACQANGNYQPIQKDGDDYYCVDDDGFMKSDPDEDEPDCSVYY